MQNQCDFANEIGYAVPLDTSCYNDFGNTWGATPENLSGAFREDYNYYYDNIVEVSERFSQWLVN